MPQYMLLLHEDKTSEGWKLSPEEIQKVFEKYLAWRKRPFVLDGRRLDEETDRVVQKKSGRLTVTDGPYSEGTEILGGYFAIEVASFEHAVKLCDEHPHLGFGTIEIREMVASPK